MGNLGLIIKLITMVLLEQENINNLDKIIKIIEVDTNFEHIGDIISLLNRYDKKRDLTSLELKKAVYTIIEALIESNNFKAIRFLNNNKKIIYTNLNDVLAYLDEYWDSSDVREYLLFFKRKSFLEKYFSSIYIKV